MRTSDGLIDLLIRNNVTPTGDSLIDIELAKLFMPKPFINTGKTTKPKKTASIKSTKQG